MKGMLRCVATMACLTLAHAADWPKNYLVEEDSASPDGRYGVLVPKFEEGVEAKDFLVEIGQHRKLGELDGIDYASHENHTSLKVAWAPDSSWCVVEIDGRFSFGHITAVEIGQGGLRQADVGARIEHDLNEALRRHSHEKDMQGNAWTYYRAGADRKMRVRALSTTDPKALHPETSENALFQGTWDIRKQKWTVTDARSVTMEQREALEETFGSSFELRGPPSTDDEARATALDANLNEVWMALRTLLPPERLAKLKEEQKEWLKHRDAAGTTAKKNRMVADRLNVLQTIAWGGIKEE